MKTIKTISFDRCELLDLLVTLNHYWYDAASNQSLSTKQLYEAALLKKWYEKHRRRHDSMIESGRKKTTIKFDNLHAILLTNVLLKCPRTDVGQRTLSVIGSVVPPQMMNA